MTAGGTALGAAGAVVASGLVGMACGGPVGWTRAQAGLRYRVGEVQHVLPSLRYVGSAPCLLREPVLAAMQQVFRYTHALLEGEGIEHWLTIGSLLGAYRHGGFIPWDDDIDLQVPLRFHDRLTALKTRIECDGYRLLRAAGGYKLATGNRWCYPYVDLIMVERRNDRMALCFPLKPDGTPTFRKAAQWPRECYLVNDIYPLGQVPFEGDEAPVPRAGCELVLRLYGEDALQTVRHRRWARWHNHLFMMTCFRLGLSGG